MISDIKDTILERIKNPFLGSLIVFWLVINWKSVFYLLFSDLSLETRFYNIEHHYYSFFKSYILPPFLAFIYTGYKDLLFDFIEKESRESEKIRRKNNNAVSLDKYNEAAEIATARARVKHISEEYKTRNELTRKIDELNTRLNSEQDKSKILKEKNDKKIIEHQEINRKYKESVESIFENYMRYEEIRTFIRDNNKNDNLDRLGRILNQMQNTAGFLSKEESSFLTELIQSNDLGEIIFDQNRKITKVNLSITGQYLLNRYLIKSSLPENEKINYTPEIELYPI